jgi:diaminopimelate decarboxylase
VPIAAAHGVRIAGAHMYVGITRRTSRFFECLDRLLVAIDALPDLEFVDIGGGYGVGYRDGRVIRLIAEPGRSVVASSGSLLVTVVSVKTRGGRRYVGVECDSKELTGRTGRRESCPLNS